MEDLERDVNMNSKMLAFVQYTGLDKYIIEKLLFIQYCDIKVRF